MKQKWIALAVFGAMLVQVAPISSMTAAALETTAISDVTATDAVLLKYNKHDTYVEITGFRANETDIVLPDTIDGLPVTTIQEGAFFSSQLTSIYIPESVTQIEGAYWWKCGTAVSGILCGDALSARKYFHRNYCCNYNNPDNHRIY